MEDVEQEKFLDQARQKVKEQSYFMKKGLEQVNLKEGLRHSAIMLEELGVKDHQSLNPKNYYILFMQIFDELRLLEQYFKEDYRRGRKMIYLYEQVQHCKKLIPRLYLLITVGSVYIQTHEVGAKEILMDLLEMIKAVQHPTRGLFLRYYFLKMCKDRLPDKDSEYCGDGGDIHDCINVITRNLGEMNKLWIRMSGKSKGKPKREQERIDLKLTVGENLHRLSSLEGVNLELYKSTVLPKLIEIVTSTKDAISQQFLVDCIIQCFPDEYHLQTLQDMLQVCTNQLDVKVDTKTIFINLMDRLAEYAIRYEEVQSTFYSDNNIYVMFKNNIDSMVEKSQNTEFKKVLDLMAAFLKFSLKCYKSNSNYVNQILKTCAIICERQQEQDFQDDCLKNIVKFLTMPLETMSLFILTMDEYPNLMKYLPFSKRRQVAIKISQAVVNSKKHISDINLANQLILFINPLLESCKDYEEVEQYEFEQEQNLVSRMVHLVLGENAIDYLKILQLFLNKFKQGGIKRQKYTYPAIMFALAKYTHYVYDSGFVDEQINFQTIFQTMKILIDALVSENPTFAMKLYLQFLSIINQFDQQKSVIFYFILYMHINYIYKKLDEFTYEIASQILTIFQDELSDADIKLQALQIIIGTLSNITCLGDENYDTLATNTTQYSSKLLKKQDQVISILNCAHLFFNDQIVKQNILMKCFQKSIKIAATLLKASPKNIGVYLYILNRFFVFWNHFEVYIIQYFYNLQIFQGQI
ncbi:vacuolar sorting protein, putative [Ichthyophthirius multifiliis]|uniref:Vacuolar protein sorting-associated protein 35 n=1 Tax=Ichthyophthirius multifiliis TaxID=5932 RepID=G0QWD2_ICHMU|nr:vacuolar sorting protein, putative [Ichthyophthirius multifiliis]EGR30479.1 vacuolar sorting protein, putative [Ichthyophthirius multifiliis]|eukprot:XP_004032066.1 vacuolar sorting protein, putative [Ichthyophthirius multifiliis]